MAAVVAVSVAVEVAAVVAVAVAEPSTVSVSSTFCIHPALNLILEVSSSH